MVGLIVDTEADRTRNKMVGLIVDTEADRTRNKMVGLVLNAGTEWANGLKWREPDVEQLPSL
jgi:hypothetical protein